MLREQISDALKEAMKAQDKRRTATLRLILAALKDRDIARRSEENQDCVSDDEILGLLSKMVKQRRESITIYEEAGRVDLAQQEAEEIVIIESFLPEQMSEADMNEACCAVVSEIGADGIKDMGRTMGELKTRYAGRMDFGQASKVVKDMLS